MSVALFGITNDVLNLVVNLLILFVIVLWLVLIAWTYFDARRRIEDGFLVVCATAASLFPFVGTIIYSILRPPEFLADRRERALEIRASELRVRQLEEASCPNCEHPVERIYLRCPSCRARIKDPCESCGKPIDPRWSVCPYCETPTRRAAPPERRAAPKRRAAKPAAAAGARQASTAPPQPRAAAPARKPASPTPRAPASRAEADAEPTRTPSSRPSRPPSSASSSSRTTAVRRPPRDAE
jgi:hypothetical protein